MCERSGSRPGHEMIHFTSYLWHCPVEVGTVFSWAYWSVSAVCLGVSVRVIFIIHSVCIFTLCMCDVCVSVYLTFPSAGF